MNDADAQSASLTYEITPARPQTEQYQKDEEVTITFTATENDVGQMNEQLRITHDGP